jgi:hypothetical protein
MQEILMTSDHDHHNQDANDSKARTGVSQRQGALGNSQGDAGARHADAVVQPGHGRSEEQRRDNEDSIYGSQTGRIGETEVRPTGQGADTVPSSPTSKSPDADRSGTGTQGERGTR